MSGRLRARPIQPGEIEPGLHPLGLDDKRDGLLYVPASYRRDKKIPLVLMLHGSKDDGGDGEAEDALNILRKVGVPLEMIVLAVDSRSFGWDDLLDDPDLAFIDRALAQTFDRYTIDPSKVAIAGFSHGASYALSAGLTNGDLFTHVIASSPNHMAPKVHLGRVRLFISHGKNDKFRSENSSREIVAQLQQAGYEVLYHPFNGSHTVPEAIVPKALDWFTASSPSET